jgi:hypothetical protein
VKSTSKKLRAKSNNQKRPRGKIAKNQPAERQPASSKRRGRSAIYCGVHSGSSQLATLEEVRDPGVPTRSLGELSHVELVTLVLERLRKDKAYPPLYMLGVSGVIDKRRAIREVKNLSPVGLHLIEIEKEYIQFQLNRR